MNPSLEGPSTLEISVFLPIEVYVLGYYFGDKMKFYPEARSLPTPPASRDCRIDVYGDFMLICYCLVRGLFVGPV